MQHFYGRDAATFSGTTRAVTRHIHALLGGVRRHRRRARVVRHPFPVRRRGGREIGRRCRPLGQPARLPRTAVRTLAPHSARARLPRSCRLRGVDGSGCGDAHPPVIWPLLSQYVTLAGDQRVNRRGLDVALYVDARDGTVCSPGRAGPVHDQNRHANRRLARARRSSNLAPAMAPRRSAPRPRRSALPTPRP